MLQRYYKILEISPTAGNEELKRAYRKLAKKYHPDVSTYPDAKERFIEITKAYETILERRNRPTHYRYAYSKAAYRRKKQNQKRQKPPRQKARQYANMNYTRYQQRSSAFVDESDFWKYRLFFYVIQFGFIGALAFMTLFLLTITFMTFDPAVLFICSLFGLLTVHVHRLIKSWKADFKNVFADQ